MSGSKSRGQARFRQGQRQHWLTTGHPSTRNAMKRIRLAMEFFDFADAHIFAYC